MLLNALPYVEMNIISIIICLLIFSQQKKDNVFDTKSFKIIIWTTITMLVLDTFSWLMINQVLPHTHWLHTFVLCSYYICQTLLPFVLLTYVLTINNKLKPLVGAILALPLVIVIICIIVNIFYPFIFELIDHDIYNRLDGFAFVAIWPLIYTLASFVISLVRFTKSTSTNKALSLHILIACLIGFVAGIISIIFINFSIWPVIALDIFYLYLMVHNEIENDLGQLAMIDGLTGVRNTIAYNLHVNKVSMKIHHKNANFCVVVMDANCLKETNDLYGHKTGDQMLITMASIIEEVFGYDNIYRIGGDEFVAILEDEKCNQRHELINKFKTKIKQEKLIVNYKQIPISVAVGMCEYKNSDMLFMDVFQKADEAMYEEKHRMKNEVGNI